MFYLLEDQLSLASSPSLFSSFLSVGVKCKHQSTGPLVSVLRLVLTECQGLLRLALSSGSSASADDLSVKLELQNSLHGVDIKMKAASPYIMGPEVW